MKKTRGYRPYEGRQRLPVWGILLLCLILAAALCFLALEIYIGVMGHTRVETGENAPDTMVIFGCKAETWGPSRSLQDRLDTALDYLKSHPDMTVIVAGGKGDDEHQSEAACMYDYLTAHGVDPDSIFQEDASVNTWQNVVYTRSLLEELGAPVREGKFLLVSSDFHLARIQMLWRRAVGSRHVSVLAAPVSHTPSRVQMFFREPLALIKSFLFDR